MNKATYKKIAIIMSVILIAVFLVSACDSPEPRIATTHYFTAGGPFSTNINDADNPRLQIRCTIVFEVIDEQAIEELDQVVFKVRSSVLSVLGELTIADITTNRNFDRLSDRLIDRLNEDIPSSYSLFERAYFTDFSLGN